MNKKILIYTMVVINIMVYKSAICSPEQSASIVTAWKGLARQGLHEKTGPGLKPETYMEYLFSNEDYSKVLLSDDKSSVTLDNTGALSGYPYNLYKFHIEQLINSIQIIWKGYAGQPFIQNVESEVNIYLYNKKKAIWDKISSERWPRPANFKYQEKTLKAKIKDISEYLNEQRDIFILAIGPYGTGESNSLLLTDFISVQTDD